MAGSARSALLIWCRRLVAVVSLLAAVFESAKAQPPQRATTPSLAQLVTPALPDAGQADRRGAVILYEEDPALPQGRRSYGAVTWRTEPAGDSTRLAVRADVAMPDRKLTLTLLIRKNSDASLAASHTLRFAFALPRDFDGGGVANVPGVLMKPAEPMKGTPLVGLAVKLAENVFLIELSDADATKASNIELLATRAWLDVPLALVNTRRGILTFEKGPSGERAFREAFAAWGEAPPAASAGSGSRPEPLLDVPLPPPPGGGYVVQVSTQRSQADAEAAYRALQEKYPSVLASRRPIILRADLGEKGVYFRASVGPFTTPDEATQFCGSLKSAGGQCVVAVLQPARTQDMRARKQ